MLTAMAQGDHTRSGTFEGRWLWQARPVGRAFGDARVVVRIDPTSRSIWQAEPGGPVKHIRELVRGALGTVVRSRSLD